MCPSWVGVLLLALKISHTQVRPLTKERVAHRRGKEDHRGHEPRQQHQDDDAFLRTPVAILGGKLNGTEPVDGDEQDRVDRGETDRVVQREPDVAEEGAEHPLILVDGQGEERHGNEADEKVADGQGEDEVVGRLPNLPVDEERDEHEHVAADGEQRDERADHGQGDVHLA